jgi:hypothetical protein
MRIARRPSIIVARNPLQHTRTRLRLAESRIAPPCGKLTRQPRMIGMRNQPPPGLRFHP